MELAARGLLVVPIVDEDAHAGNEDGCVRLQRCDANGAFAGALPLVFRDATHALQVALFAEWRCAAPLAKLTDDDARRAAEAWEAHTYAGRCTVATLLPRWRAAGALFAADGDDA